MTENGKLPFVLGITAILTAVIVMYGVNSYKNKIFELGFENTVNKLENSIALLDAEGSDRYFYSPLYSDTEISDYSKKPLKFLKEYIGIKKDCGNSNGSCFASKYKDENNKEYRPEYKGSCAVLKNGTSICMIPQIGKKDIYGIMDMNGKKSPNVLGKDLRLFKIKAKERDYDSEDDVEGSINYVNE